MNRLEIKNSSTEDGHFSPELERQLNPILLYQPNILFNANFVDANTKNTVAAFASHFKADVNNIELLDNNYYKKHMIDPHNEGYGECDFGNPDLAIEVITKATRTEGLHHKLSRELKAAKHIQRIVLDMTEGTVEPLLAGIRDMPVYGWPSQASRALSEIQQILEDNPEKRWFPHFAEHLDWLGRNVIKFRLAEFAKLVPYNPEIMKEYSTLLVVDTTPKESDSHPLQRSHLLETSMTLKSLDTGYVHVDCLSGCGAEIPSVPLKEDGRKGTIVVGSHCGSCGNEYRPKFPKQTLQKFLAKL